MVPVRYQRFRLAPEESRFWKSDQLNPDQQNGTSLIMKIATMATGGIGGFLAVRLGLSGHDVATIARGAHLDAIRKDGLTLSTSDGKATVRPWKATSDPAEVGEVDAIILAVKGNDLEAAAEACRPMLGPETVIIPFLNGVEAAARTSAILPPENVADGVAYISTTIAAPGLIQQTGDFNKFVFAERDNKPSPRIDALRQAINEAGSSAPATDDIGQEVWSKFVFFAALSGVTAAARCTLKDVIDNAVLTEVFQAAISETATVARKRGVALSETIEEDTWSYVTGLPPNVRASTAIDLENGRPLEIEWISGAVMRFSEAAGLEAPVSRTPYALLCPHRSGNKR